MKLKHELQNVYSCITASSGTTYFNNGKISYVNKWVIFENYIKDEIGFQVETSEDYQSKMLYSRENVATIEKINISKTKNDSNIIKG